jgi:Rieske Fe-S protein
MDNQKPAADGPRPSRRRLTLLAWLSFLPLGWVSFVTARARGRRPQRPKRHIVRGPLPQGLTVEGPVALWCEGDSVTAVSRRCPHLGCTVRPRDDGTLACPCHGSRFDPRGQVQRGPARADLEPLRVTRGPEEESFLVDLPS